MAEDIKNRANPDDYAKSHRRSKPLPLKRTRSKLSRSARSSRLLIPWFLSLFLAFSLFQTFSYLPPDLPDKHPHINQIDVPTISTGAGSATATKSGVSKSGAAKQFEGSSRGASDIPRSSPSVHTIAKNQTIWKEGSSGQTPTFYGEAGLAALHLPVDASSVILSEVPENHPMQQNPILSVLREAVVDEIPLDDWKSLPELARNLSDLYGSRIVSARRPKTVLDEENTGPIVLGMETCEAYRNNVPLLERYTGPAGMFNTGTNALTHHLSHNIERIGNAWQIPWGKHRMEWRRLNHVASGMEKRNQTAALPVVIIRDPYHWMQSMCKSAYSAHWKHAKNRCPNLFAGEQDHKRWNDLAFNSTNSTSFQVKVIFDKDDKVLFDSLVGLWSIWYKRYLNATYPHLIIRFEDMLLQAPAVLAKIAECVGTAVRDPIEYQRGSAKAHGSHTDFLKAILKSADGGKREHGLTAEDKEYAVTHLDKDLMEAFHYRVVT